MDFSQWLKQLFASEPITCEPSNDIAALVTSILLTVGMFVSYLPQHVKIILLGSSEGLSPTYLLLGAMSMSSVLLNTTLLQFPLFGCCAEQTLGVCLQGLLGIMQIGVQFLCFYATVLLYYVYFPMEQRYTMLPSTEDADITSSSLKGRSSRLWRHSLRIGVLLSLYNVLVITVSVVLLVVWGDAQSAQVTEYWADAMGLSAMVLSVCQFFPQIIVTWKNKSVGALSIPTMLIQAPGSFLFVYSLAVRPGNNVTTWITYACTGVLQAFLLVLAMYYHCQERRRHCAAEAVSIENVSLLGEQQQEDMQSGEFKTPQSYTLPSPYFFSPSPPPPPSFGVVGDLSSALRGGRGASGEDRKRPHSSSLLQRFRFFRRSNNDNNNNDNIRGNGNGKYEDSRALLDKENYENPPLLRSGFEYPSSTRLYHHPSASNSANSSTSTVYQTATTAASTPTPDPPLASPSSDRHSGFEQLHRLSRPMAVSTDSLPEHSLTLVGNHGVTFGLSASVVSPGQRQQHHQQQQQQHQ